MKNLTYISVEKFFALVGGVRKFSALVRDLDRSSDWILLDDVIRILIGYLSLNSFSHVFCVGKIGHSSENNTNCNNKTTNCIRGRRKNTSCMNLERQNQLFTLFSVFVYLNQLKHVLSCTDILLSTVTYFHHCSYFSYLSVGTSIYFIWSFYEIIFVQICRDVDVSDKDSFSKFSRGIRLFMEICMEKSFSRSDCV